MALLRIILLTVGHFVVALLSAFATFGWDLDRLRSRSVWSRATGIVYDILLFPHNPFMRALPNAWFIRTAHILTPAAVIVNSLLWGIFLYALWRVWEARRRGGPGK